MDTANEKAAVQAPTLPEEDTKALIADRSKVIVRTGIIGIGANLLLAGFKAAVGLAANSVAVVSDAINNLTDALSSIITIIGTKLAGKAPDKKHPLGYGRIEYMSALIVSAIVLYAGITALVDSVQKIITPGEVDYSIITLVVLSVAIAVKIALGAYTTAMGKSVNSGSLIASGKDASQDAILSGSVLISALIYMFFNINIEAWVGAVISIFIIKAGVEMISDAVNEMLGARADEELTKSIKDTVAAFPEVHGVYDLIINNYGPDYNIASVHVEVNDTLTANDIDTLSRHIQDAVYSACGVIIVAVGIYSVNTGSDEIALMRSEIRKLVMSHEGVLQFHGFYADLEKKVLSFDIILDFALGDRSILYDHIYKDVTEAYPDFKLNITLDVDAG